MADTFTLQAKVDREFLVNALDLAREIGVEAILVDAYEVTPGDATTRRLRLRSAEGLFVTLKVDSTASWTAGSASLAREDLERVARAVPTTVVAGWVTLTNDPQTGTVPLPLAGFSWDNGASIVAIQSSSLKAN